MGECTGWSALLLFAKPEDGIFLAFGLGKCLVATHLQQKSFENIMNLAYHETQDKILIQVNCCGFDLRS